MADYTNMSLDYGLDRVRQLIRLSFETAQTNQESILETSVDEILGYFSRRSDVSTIRSALKERYAVGITKVNNAAGQGFETYKKGLIGEAIDSGLYETVSSGLSNKIINSLGTMFTMPTQSWRYLSYEGDQNDDISEIINKHRELGLFDTEMITADRIACAVESCPILIQLAGGHLTYQSFSPACIYPVYNNQILDNGELRGTNQLDLEDCTCVVIKLATASNVGQNNNYLAIFGRSKNYEYGRHVQYQSKDWKNIPKVGDPNCVDHKIDGEIANPLSWLAAKNPTKTIPEFPVIVIRGGQSLTREKLIEVNDSLYNSCVEVDIAYSKILKDALSASTGVKIFKNPGGEPIPRTNEGTIILLGQQTFDIPSISGANAQIALSIVGNISKSIGEGYSVPAYQILQDNVEESGIALYIRTKPLIDHRNFRIKLNKPQIDKCFEIEKGLLEISSGKDLGDIKQVWDAGSYEIPESESEKNSRLKSAMDNKFISYVAAVREYNNLPTDDDAIAMILQIKEQNSLYSPSDSLSLDNKYQEPGDSSSDE